MYPYYIKAPSDSLAKPIKQLLTGMCPDHGKQSMAERSATQHSHLHIHCAVMGHLRLKGTYNGFYLVPASLGKDEVIQYKAENASGCILALHLTVRTLRMKSGFFSSNLLSGTAFPCFLRKWWQVSLLHISCYLTTVSSAAQLQM